ncbi:MAG: alpha/beta hydrolase [Steroidobacteraceae bacterium]
MLTHGPRGAQRPLPLVLEPARAQRLRGARHRSLRGHGRSDGRRADIVSFAAVVADLGALLQRAKLAHPGLPCFLFGHSMGGALAFDCALRNPEHISGLLLSAPLLAMDPAAPAWRVALVRLLARVAPGLGAITLPADTISRDPEMVRAYEEDPLVYRGAIPARTIAELFANVATLAARAPQLRMPLLYLHGSGDRLVPLAHSRTVVERAGSGDRTLRIYEGLYHEILNEPEREQVARDISDWVAARLPA